MLLDRGATHEAEYGCTPLHEAASEGYVDICELLLDRGATHELNDTGQTPLHLAGFRKHAEVCKLLIQRDAIDRGSRHRPEPLPDSSTHGFPKTAETDKQGNTQLSNAAYCGNLEFCAALLAAGASHQLNRRGDTPLHRAAQAGHMDVCVALLENGAATNHPNNCGNTPLHRAAQTGRLDVCAVLLDKGVTHKLNSSKDTPLHQAAFVGFVDVCELLLERGASLGKGENTPLRRAILGGHAGVCELLLRKEPRLSHANLTIRFYSSHLGAAMQKFGKCCLTTELHMTHLGSDPPLYTQLRRMDIWGCVLCCWTEEPHTSQG